MKSKLMALCLLAGALAWPATTAQAAGADDTTPDRPEVEIEHGDVVLPPLPEGLRDLIAEFKLQRQEILAARQALLEALKTATEEEKKALIEAFRRDQRERIRAERELRKEIRRRLQELRRQRRADAGGSSGPGSGDRTGSGSGG